MFKPLSSAALATQLRALSSMAIVLVLCACASTTVPPSKPKDNAKLTPATRTTRDLTRLPEPKVKLPVAVYGFRDQTGQYKPMPDSSYSTAVSQGAASMLVMALKESGWYIPVEREGLQNLLTERRIVRAIESPLDKGKPAINLPNLTPASMLVEGGIVAYESNVRTGGKGANYLGLGASTQYRVDQVTVVLRNIDIKTGYVLNSVSVTKTIYSYQFSTSVYKFTAFRELLQGETGFTTNEPSQMALREAIELAVIQMTVDGIRDRNLALKRPEDWSSPIIQEYAAADNANFAERTDGNQSKEFVPMRPREAERKRVVAPSSPYDAESVSSLLAKQPVVAAATNSNSITNNANTNVTGSAAAAIPAPSAASSPGASAQPTSSVVANQAGSAKSSSKGNSTAGFSEAVMPLPSAPEAADSKSVPTSNAPASSTSASGASASNTLASSNSDSAKASPSPAPAEPVASAALVTEASQTAVGSEPTDIFQLYFKKK